MMTKYIENKNEDGVVVSINHQDGYSIPIDPANSDYQRYLRYLAGEPEEGTLGTKSALDETNSK